MKNYWVLLIIALAALTLSFRNDKVELEDRGLVVALGIDRTADNKFAVTVSMPNILEMKEAPIADKSKLVKTANDGSISGALHNINTSQNLYMGQTKMLVLGRELLNDADFLRQSIDSMERSREVSHKLYLLAAKEQSAEDILSLKLEGESMIGITIDNYYDSGGEAATKFSKTLGEVISDLRSTGDTLIPIISADTTDEESGSGHIGIGGCAVIKDFKLSRYLNEEETRGYMWLTADNHGSVVNSPDNIPLRVYHSKPRISFENINGKINCHVKLSVKGSIDEYNFSEEDLDAPFRLEEYAAAFENIIADEIKNTADILRRNGADVYCFKEMLRKKDYKLYADIEQEFETHFRDMVIIPYVNVDIISVGTIK
ncbi:MAG: Ger(x)C family spore germination protein [Clostridiales bacterium]|nr:Ger(x)C family spore germination protein [Clostridiales bacterium]